MKKLSLILLISSIVLTSCNNTTPTINSPEYIDTLIQEQENINKEIDTQSNPSYPEDFENIYSSLGKSEESCKGNFYNFYVQSLEFSEFGVQVQYYDLFKKNNDCLLWYYYAHEMRNYWNVVNLSKNNDIEFETSCMPDYNVELDTFTYCNAEAIGKTHLEYQAYMSNF